MDYQLNCLPGLKFRALVFINITYDHINLRKRSFVRLNLMLILDVFSRVLKVNKNVQIQFSSYISNKTTIKKNSEVNSCAILINFKTEKFIGSNKVLLVLGRRTDAHRENCCRPTISVCVYYKS
jgi:hypothetical protein